MPDSGSNLFELIRVVAEEAYGFTLCSGKLPILHTEAGTRELDGPVPTAQDVNDFLHRVLDSRHLREYRTEGVIRFFYTHHERIQFVGGARREGSQVRIELRRMPPTQPD